MKCPNCGKEQSNGATFCADCNTSLNAPNAPVQGNAQYVQQQPMQTGPAPKKKKTGRIIALIVAAVVVLGVISLIFGGGDENTDDAKEPPKASNSASQSASNDNAEKTSYAINEPASHDDAEITVTKVERSAGGNYDKPKEGMEFVIVTIQIKNIGDKDNLSYNPYGYKMKNSQGQIVDSAITLVNSDTSLSSGELAPGGTISGTIAFEQPKGDTGLELQYTGNIWLSNSTLTFVLQ